MSDLKCSIFDNLTQDTGLWTKQVSSLQDQTDEILHQGYLLKSCKRRKKYTSRYFVLTSTKLLYTKKPESTTIYRSLDLKWARVCYETCAYNGRPHYVIKFVNNSKYSNLILEDVREYEVWRRHLLNVCVQTNFKERFVPVGELGHGGFSSVYLALSREEGNRYAVKAYNKAALNEQPNLVLMLLSEIRILRQLEHTNIVKLYEVMSRRTQCTSSWSTCRATTCSLGSTSATASPRRRSRSSRTSYCTHSRICQVKTLYTGTSSPATSCW